MPTKTTQQSSNFLYLRLMFAVLLALAPLASRADTADNDKKISEHLNLLTESVSDVSGGMRQETRFDSVLHAGVDVPTAAFSDFGGGEIYFDVAAIRSGEPSANVIGDAQAVSNIAAPNAFRLYELWYAQSFAGDLVEGRAGVIGFDDYFDVTEAGSDLINSTYGTTPTLSGNVAAPIYPIPGAAVMAVVHRGHWQGQFGVFQGNPEQRETALRDGRLVVGEADWFRDPADETQGAWKIGLWQYEWSGNVPREDWGGYLTYEHPAGRWLARPIQAFVTLGASPKEDSPITYSAAAGFRFPGPSGARPNDALSIGVAAAHIEGGSTEQSYEATYVFALGDHFTVQPDVQYVVNPGGGDLPAAWVFILRLGAAL
jgi:porin